MFMEAARRQSSRDMKKLLNALTLGGLMVAFSGAAALAADDDKKKPEKKKGNPEARFTKLDANNDGFLDADELKAGFKKKPEMAEKVLKAKDKDDDGKISKEEFLAKPERKKKKPEGDAPDKKDE